MTFKQKYRGEIHWVKKVYTMSFYHNIKLYKNSKWKVSDTARYFEVSEALVSENLKLAVGLVNDESLELLSRNAALNRIKHGPKIKVEVEET